MTGPIVDHLRFTSSPEDIASRYHIKSKVNRFIALSSMDTFKTQAVNFKLFEAKKSTLYRLAYKISLVALVSLALVTTSLLALHASAYLFPFLTFYAIGCYLICPKVARFLKVNELKEKLNESNRTKCYEELNRLQNLSRENLKQIFAEIDVNVSHYAPIAEENRILREDDAISFLLPILAKYRFWLSQVKETQAFQEELTTKLVDIKTQISKDDGYSKVKLLQIKNELAKAHERLKTLQKNTETEHHEVNTIKKQITQLESQKKLPLKDKQSLIKQGLELSYQIEDLDQETSLKHQKNAKLLSAIKAAYFLEFLKNPTQSKSFLHLGSINPRLRHTRQLFSGTQTGDAYLVSNNGASIDLSGLKDHIFDLEWIRRKLFSKAF